jgi:Rnl2 family RNA ligase
MEFKKYSSIENSYREKVIDQIKQIVPPNEEWFVTEKIHGANFSFLTDGNEIRCAKRSGIIEESENFYNHNIVLEKYKDEVKNIFKFLKDEFKDTADLQGIQLYGEIFGGYYPNTENKYKPIQKGVYYTNDIEFIAFDLRIKLKTKITKIEIDTLMDPKRFIEIMDKFNIPTVKVLYKGTLDECLKYPNDFESTISEYFGMPKIEGNICEGVVIKPFNRNYFLSSGSRVILKNKNEKFKEKSKTKKAKKVIKLTEEEQKYLNDLSRYFVINRLENLLSKGEVKLDWKEFGKITGLFFKDALEDFVKDNPDYLDVDKKRRKLIQNEAQKIVSNFIREFMKKHI